MQTSHPHIYLYLGVYFLTFTGIIYLKPVSLTNTLSPFHTSLRPYSLFDFIKSLCNSLIDICIAYLPTLWFFLPVNLLRTKIVYFAIGDATTDGWLRIHS